MDDARAWETTSLEAIYDELGSGPAGLEPDEAAHRLATEGANALPVRPPPPLWKTFLRQFISPLIAILAVAGALALAIGEVTDAGFIAAVLLLNASIGGVQEWRAERGAFALRGLISPTATVQRGGIQVVPAAQLVRGDVVRLESGQGVPADMRLIDAHGLEIDESLLTGESMATRKDAQWATTAIASVGDRLNMVHAGTHVVRGRAIGIVVATGLSTEVGRIAETLQRGGLEAPLILRMRRFAHVVAVAAIVAATTLALLGVWRGEPVHDMVFFAVAAAVSAVPEGLPVALTIALAFGTSRMARRNVVVRRLAAVEGLGSCTAIATDKTGTLTMNALTVRQVVAATSHQVSGEGFSPEGTITPGGPELDPIIRAACLCNEATLDRKATGWTWQGDPTDVALLSLALKHGADPRRIKDAEPMVQQIPFEPEHRYAATFHGTADVQVVVKGAPETVLPMCRTGDAAIAERMAAQGLRVLAFARGPARLDQGLPTPPKDLELLGFVGMMDPPRPGVADAIRTARSAGVHVVMVTGDHPTTAQHIATSVGIPEGLVITGTDMAQWNPETLADRARGATVFARVAPDQKVQVVQALQAAGHFVAVTGDGVNDAPALRAAHIGVAMGKDGTDVAREAADIILADDRFPSIVAGIEEGRIAYRNVRNVIFLLISTGAAELFLLLLALMSGSPLPLLPAQLLWLNLVTNGIQDVALGMEPGQGDELQQRPRDPKERIFNGIMIQRTLLTAAVMGGGGFIVFQWLLAAGWELDAARNALLLLLVLFENLHVGNSRSETRSAFALNPLRNPYLLWGVVLAQGIHIASMYIPFMQAILHVQPVTWQVWLTLFTIALSITIAFEAHKAIRRRLSSHPTGR